MALLSKDAILAAQDRKSITVDVPEWGGEVRLMEMSGEDRLLYLSSILTYVTDKTGKVSVEANNTNADAKLLARCIVDENGNRLFTEAEIAKLGSKNGIVLDRLVNEANSLNAIAPGSVDDAEGKSEATQNSDSTTD